MTGDKIFRIVLSLFVSVLLTIVLVSSFEVLASSPDEQNPTRLRELLVDHDVDINGDLDVDGTTNLDAIDIDGTVDFADTLNVDGAVTLNSTLDVDGNLSSGTGAFTVADSINVTGAADFDSTLNVDDAVTLNSTLDVDGNISSGTGAFTITDNLLIDGVADAIQLTAQGYTTQTNDIFVVEQSDGSDVFNVDNTGNVTVGANLKMTSGIFTIEETDNTATGTQTITPTQTYYHFSPTAVTTVTIATGSAVEGDFLIIHNLVATSTTIVDTGATQGGSDIILGLDDVAGFIFGDGVWVELFSPDNS